MVANPYEGIKLFNKLNKVADKFLDVHLSLLGAVPFDACVRKSVQKQQAFVEAYPGAKSTLAIQEIADKLMHQPASVLQQGSVSFFLEQMFNNEAVLLGV
jgi:flagellar biosynthesis protein FlhG